MRFDRVLHRSLGGRVRSGAPLVLLYIAFNVSARELFEKRLSHALVYGSQRLQ